MAEVQLTAALLIQQIDGMQDLNKKSIDRFYRRLNSKFPEKTRHESRFQSTIHAIMETFKDDLKTNQFRNSAFFYTLFGVVYHRMFGMPKVRLNTPKKPLSASVQEKLRDATRRLSRVISIAREEQQVGGAEKRRRSKIPSRFRAFAAAATSQSDNIAPRQTRFVTLYREAFR